MKSTELQTPRQNNESGVYSIINSWHASPCHVKIWPTPLANGCTMMQANNHKTIETLSTADVSTVNMSLVELSAELEAVMVTL